MKVTLRHAIKINAPRSRVFAAISSAEAMSQWHHGPVEGEIAVGAIFRLHAKAGMTFGWETTEIDPDSRIVQVGVEGPGSENPKTLTITLSDIEGAGTLVELTEAVWDESDPSLPYCNTHWGWVLHRLKDHTETG